MIDAEMVPRSGHWGVTDSASHKIMFLNFSETDSRSNHPKGVTPIYGERLASQLSQYSAPEKGSQPQQSSVVRVIAVHRAARLYSDKQSCSSVLRKAPSYRSGLIGCQIAMKRHHKDTSGTGRR